MAVLILDILPATVRTMTASSQSQVCESQRHPADTILTSDKEPEILRTGSPLSISYTAGEEAPATKTSATDTPTQEATVEDGSKENRSEGQQCEGCGREWGYILSCLEGLRFESDGKVQLHAPLPVHDDLDGLDFS